MKAVICTKYGPPEVLKIKEVEKPVPKDNKDTCNNSTCGDAKIRSFNPGLGPVKDFFLKGNNYILSIA